MASSSAAVETASAVASYSNFATAEIQNCGMGITKPANTFAVFADYDPGVQNQNLLNFSSWNHTANGNTATWANLKHPAATYNFANTASVNASCNGVDTINTVLVKKIANWDNQHSNGFDRDILSFGHKFKDIKNIVIDMKVNSAKTSIPSVATLKSTYASYVSAAQVDALDEGKVNIRMSLYDGKTQSVWQAKTIFQLDQSVVSDKWIRVTIPMSGITHCLEENYNCAPKPFSELAERTIAGIQFVGEVKNGLVLRNAMGNSWNDNAPPPETFKEMDISIKKIEFELK